MCRGSMSRPIVAVGAVRMLAGFEMRRRGRRVLFLTLLVGVVGAVVLSAVAGARRSESVLARFNASSRAAQLELTVGDATPSQLQAFGRVKGVAAVAPLLGIALKVPRRATSFGSRRSSRSPFRHRRGSRSGHLGSSCRSKQCRRGHDRRGARGTAAPRSRWSSRRRGVHPQQIEQCSRGRVRLQQADPPDGPRIRLRIVGIVRRPLDLGDRGAVGGVLVLTPAFNQKYENRHRELRWHDPACPTVATVPPTWVRSRRARAGSSGSHPSSELKILPSTHRAPRTRSTCSWWRCGHSLVSLRSRARRDHDRDEPARSRLPRSIRRRRGRWVSRGASASRWVVSKRCRSRSAER